MSVVGTILVIGLRRRPRHREERESEREKIDVTDLTPEENEKQAKELSF